MTTTRPMDPVRRAGRTALAGAIERRLTALGVPDHGTLLVAVSGGADSMALLLLATVVARRRGWTIEAATVDHHLRAASAEEAAHAMGFARSIGVPCTLVDVFPGPGPGAPERARRARYRALVEHARSRGIAAVVTAHHARDQLETILMALLRGAGARAVGGMRDRRRIAAGVEVIRPLLETPAEALPALLRKLGVEWRHDPTNDDLTSPRVRIRREVVPVLEGLRPGAARRAALSAMLLRGAGGAFGRGARRRVERDARSGTTAAPHRDAPGASRPILVLPRVALARRSRAMRLEMIRHALVDVGGTPSSRTIERIDEAVADGAEHERRWRLRGGASVRLVADRIEFSSRTST